MIGRPILHGTDWLKFKFKNGLTEYVQSSSVVPNEGYEAGTRKLQDMQGWYREATWYKAAMKGTRPLWYSYKGYKVDTRQLQGVQRTHEAATRDTRLHMRQVEEYRVGTGQLQRVQNRYEVATRGTMWVQGNTGWVHDNYKGYKKVWCTYKSYRADMRYRVGTRQLATRDTGQLQSSYKWFMAGKGQLQEVQCG